MIDTKQIYKMAKSIGLGAECKAEMTKDHTLKNLGLMYFKGSDWSMQHDFPNVKILRELKGKTEQLGLYTDCVGEVEAKPRLAIFGNSDVSITYDGYSVGEIIIRHDAKVTIKAKDNSFLIINVLDRSNVKIEAENGTTVTVHVYSTMAQITKGDNVKMYQAKFE